MNWLFVAGLQLVFVLGIEEFTRNMSMYRSNLNAERHSLCHVKFETDFIIQLQLHNKEGVPGLTLSERRVKPQNDECMGIIILGKQEEFLDRAILNLVVVCLAT